MMERRNSMFNIVFFMFFIFSLFTCIVDLFQQFYSLIVNIRKQGKCVSFIFSFVYIIHIFQLGSQK